MTAAQLLILLLSRLITTSLSIDVDVNGIAIKDFQSSGIEGDVGALIQEEAQVINTLIELDSQLEETLTHVSSASGSVEIDVEVTESDETGSWVDEEIIVIIPDIVKISDKTKDKIKTEIESEVADKLDAMIVENAVEPEVEHHFHEEISLADKVERLYEEEAEAERELNQMQQDLVKALDALPDNGPSEEIDIVVIETDKNGVEVIDEEIVAEIPASTGTGPRLTEEEMEELEQAVVNEAANALGTAVLNAFVGDSVPQTEVVELPRLDQAVQAERGEVEADPEPKPALRRERATTTAHPGFEHPLFAPHRWQSPPDEQLWTMKLSMLTSISCLTLIVMVGVWTGVRRSRRTVLTDSNFRWAEAVEYMDAFPYED